MEGTKSELGIFYNSIFSTLTEIDLQWNVYYLAAESDLGKSPETATLHRWSFGKRKLLQGACLAI